MTKGARALPLERGLPDRLRRETAELHAAVEAAVGLPGSVYTRSDYVVLLQRLHELHSGLEDQLTAGRWRRQWRDIGVDVTAHRRSHLLSADLRRLGAPTVTGALAPVPFASFGQALGCLYVMEGSALGGSIVAGVIRSAIGAVPMAFFDGDNHHHPAPWQAVRAALSRCDAHGVPADDVLVGARDTFLVFGAQLGARARLA